MENKTCTICNQEKPLTEEYFDKASPSAPTQDGWKGRCSQCRRDKRQDWRKEYKAKYGECDSRRWQRANGERLAKNKDQRMQELREWLNKLKDQPCMDCGQKLPAVCMDFDHVRGEKKYNIALMIVNVYSRKAILEEIAKCDIVCSNCHRIRTWNSERETPWYDKIRKYDRSDW